MVVRTEDRDGNLQVSVKQARATVDWDNAEKLLDNGDTYAGQIIAANKGGLIVPFGELRGFVPASHVIGVPRGLDDDERREYLQRYVGKTLDLKVIEVNARRRRLVLSQRAARREAREEAKERLLEELTVGDVVDGTVSSLRDFGAFVDIGGADGLIHVSELAWHRINHPSEIVQPGDKIKAQIIQLDQEDMRIGLSLKRLLPNPWDDIAAQYDIGMQVQGIVSRIVSFGAFVELDNGIEALLHISELSDPAPDHVEDVVAKGDVLSAEIVSLEPDRQRMGLSIKNIALEEEDAYLGEEALA
jgi:small subunit ribosomal protein S1